MSAERLRAAAEFLREGVGHEPCCSECGGTGVAGYEPCWDCRATGCPHDAPPAMPDPLALALADWLDRESVLSSGWSPGEALRVANVILGGEE